MSSAAHQRDPSVARGRVGQSAAPSSSSTKTSLSSLAQRALSPSSYTAHGSGGQDNLTGMSSRSTTPAPPPLPPSSITGQPAPERRPSVSYGHHRQTSVVPTPRNHSRQNSLAHSPASSMANLKSPPGVFSPPIGNILSPPPAAMSGMASVSEMGHSALPLDTFDFRSPQSTTTATFQPFPTLTSVTTSSSSTTAASASTLTNNEGHSTYTSSIASTILPDNIQSTMRPSRSTTTTTGPSRSDSSSTSLTRKKSTKPKHSHGRSGSHDNEEKTVGEYALQHLFKAFTRKADAKIDMCVSRIPHEILTVEEICGVGVDPEFDALIQALGHISQNKPKLLVDTSMVWRGMKAQELQEASTKWRNIRSNAEARQQAMEESRETGQLFATYYERVERAEKRVTIAIFLICRVLMQVYSQCDIKQITDYLDNKIEDLMFEQLTRLDPEKVATSSLHRSNWVIYSQLLGLISYRNFGNVNLRFTKLLQQVQEEVGPKGAVVAANSAVKVELVIRAMSYMCIRTHPDAEWQQSVDFLIMVAKLFTISHGQIVKTAYCSVLQTLILPFASCPGTQLAAPRWKEVISILNQRVGQLVQKPRYWEDAFPLQTLLLCVSPNDVFTSQWGSFVNGLQAKLKDRGTRSLALQSICRLVWTYLNRATDPSSSMRKLEDVVRTVLPTGKKSFLSTDPAFAEPTVEFIRLIGYRFPEWCFKVIIFPLLNADLFASGREIRAQELEPERTVIGIRAFMAVITDLEAASQTFEPPKFPSFSRQGVGYEAIPRIKPAGKTDDESSQPDISSQPVKVGSLSDGVRHYYNSFCEILGKITLICDNAFGGQAALDEKFGANANANTPKTPLTGSFTFNQQSNHAAQQGARQGFYDLLHVAVQALPRFMSSQIPFNPLINLLCTGTAHVQPAIAASSGDSLKAIARQSHAQQVTVGFARFIFNFDARYSTMSEEGLLGPGHIESTLKLYLELLHVWIDEIKQKTKGAASIASPIDASQRANTLEVTGVSALVDEIESHGVFFMCSQSRRVRHFAVQVMKIVTEFDQALGKENPRIISILKGDLLDVISPDDNRLTVAERSRLQKGKRRGSSQNGLIELCSSEITYDTTLWNKVFPNIVHQALDLCPFTITLSREIVCARLLQMRNTINNMEDYARATQGPNFERTPVRHPAGQEAFVEQWKLYLVMACTTMQNAGAQSQSQLAQHARSKSKNPQSGENFNSARSLFAYMIPLLGAMSPNVRNGVVHAMGSINKLMYRTLLESLQYAVTSVNDETKARIIGAVHTRAGSAPRSRRHDDMRKETAHVYRLTSKFLQDDDVLKDEWIVNNLIRYTDDLRMFLSDSEIQNDWYFQSLRQYYCGLLEEVFEGVNRTKDPSRWMSFEARKAAFTLIEDWCGYSPNQAQIAAREEAMKSSILNGQPDSNFTASVEIEKRKLKMAALSAMASLCAGPISIQVEKATVSFDAKRLLEWIDQVVADPSDKMHAIGRRAMKNLIKHNDRYPPLLERVIDRCVAVGFEKPKALESYFDVVYDVLTEKTEYPLHLWRVLGMLVITLGYEKGHIRSKSARLLRNLEERHYPERTSKLQDFDISVSDKTTAIYKLAQFEISKRLSKTHNEIAFLVFSQFCLQYKLMKGDYQRNMIAAMLPWVQVLELEVDQNNTPTQQTYMVLVNLIEITTKSSTALHNEIQALWQALATGPHAGNVQLVLNFAITLCMERREQSFVDYARQIVVYLSSTHAGQKVVEYLLLQITPRNMVHTDKPMPQILTEKGGFPYVAELSDALPIGGRQSGFSLGQLSLILLVDLMVAPVNLAPEYVPLLLQICVVLWDHHIPLVQEQAREMLVHLIHELVISEYDNLGDVISAAKKSEIEEFVEAIRQSKAEVIWNYSDNDAGINDAGVIDDSEGMRVPPSMQHVAKQIIGIFSLNYRDVHDQWAKASLSWATSCSVRHLACRSFQIFRCVFANLDGSSLADILARLSNTVADETPEVQGFAMEILCTLKTVIATSEARELLKYPQLFYVTCACLSTVNEPEFVEVLQMVEALLSKFNLSDPAVLKILTEAKPEWSGEFEGLLPNVYKGLKSASAMEKTLEIIVKTAPLPSHVLIGKGSRYPFAVLAYLPSFLNALETGLNDSKLKDDARILASAAECDGHGQIAESLTAFADDLYSGDKAMLNRIVSAVARSYFPQYQVQCLIFLMGMLSNKTSWCKLKTLDILQVVIPEIDLRSPEMISYGSDLISPLLRLLQTEYCSPALKLMDVIMKRNPTPVEPQNLRMSMILSGTGNVKAKKEFERTKSLYGIPEDSGWSIPMPVAHAKVTRENVHNVFYTCAALNSADEPPQATPDIEFDREDYQDRQYFGIQRSDTVASEDVQRIDEGDTRVEPDYTPTDLVSKLDSLDDFFDDLDSNDYSHQFNEISNDGYGSDSEAGHTVHTTTYREERPKPPVRANTSLDHFGMTAIHNPYSHQRTHINPSVMTPGAFFDSRVSTASDNRSSGATIRPSYHYRSVTSPSQATHMRDASGSSTRSVQTMQSVHEFLSSSDGEEDDDSIPTISNMLSPRTAGGHTLGINGLTPVFSPNDGLSPFSAKAGGGYFSPGAAVTSTMVRSYSSAGNHHYYSSGGRGGGAAGMSPNTEQGDSFGATGTMKRNKSSRMQQALKESREREEAQALRGGAAGRARSRSAAMRSPEVPKVPEAFLQDKA